MSQNAGYHRSTVHATRPLPLFLHNHDCHRDDNHIIKTTVMITIILAILIIQLLAVKSWWYNVGSYVTVSFILLPSVNRWWMMATVMYGGPVRPDKHFKVISQLLSVNIQCHIQHNASVDNHRWSSEHDWNYKILHFQYLRCRNWGLSLAWKSSGTNFVVSASKNQRMTLAWTT